MENTQIGVLRQRRGGHPTNFNRNALVQTPQPPSVLQPAKSDLEIFLRDRQFGIGTSQGGLAMTTALKAHLAEHPTHVVACLDFKNAFGTIDRGTCMKVRESPWFQGVTNGVF